MRMRILGEAGGGPVEGIEACPILTCDFSFHSCSRLYAVTYPNLFFPAHFFADLFASD
jgi:hypothetical protein